ncbi:uncharacterized protein LOC110741970 isoform X2 [Papio anubis]|uniref:uncharacterized protein LOC110741970 isoform X2 n=1 Tax=Papio anubis TaxID=9555 RepID=UPI0012AE4363|nr:uncharacterized protein LOC110741970 isoform X2 [Papio anubis]
MNKCKEVNEEEAGVRRGMFYMNRYHAKALLGTITSAGQPMSPWREVSLTPCPLLLGPSRSHIQGLGHYLIHEWVVRMSKQGLTQRSCVTQPQKLHVSIGIEGPRNVFFVDVNLLQRTTPASRPGNVGKGKARLVLVEMEELVTVEECPSSDSQRGGALGPCHCPRTSGEVTRTVSLRRISSSAPNPEDHMAE